MVAAMTMETILRRRSADRAPHGGVRPWPARRIFALCPTFLCPALLCPAVVLSLVLAAGLGALAGPAAAQTETQIQPGTEAPAAEAPATEAPAPRQIQDWTLRCDAPAAGSLAGPCYMVQDIAAPEGQGRIAQMIVGHFGQDRLLGALVFVPLGTRLPPGLVIGVDKNQPRRFPFQLCSPNGCQAQIALDDAFLAELKSGATAEAVFEDANGRKLTVQISLRGFTAALKEAS